MKRHGFVVGWIIGMVILAIAGSPGTFLAPVIQVGSALVLAISIALDAVCNAVSDRWNAKVQPGRVE